MTTKKIFHARSTGMTLPDIARADGTSTGGRILLQWEEFEVTDALLDATRDRDGNSWLLMDAGEQTRRWGSVKFQEGRAPEGMTVGADDEYFQYKRGLAAREHAQAISDPIERRAALTEVNREFGAVLSPVAQRVVGGR